MKITIAQLNTVIGDFDGNLKKLTSALKEAEGAGSDLVIFSEMFITGYPPRDLLERRRRPRPRPRGKRCESSRWAISLTHGSERPGPGRGNLAG